MCNFTTDLNIMNMKLLKNSLMFLAVASAIQVSGANAYVEPRDTTPVDKEAWARFTAPLEIGRASCRERV